MGLLAVRLNGLIRAGKHFLCVCLPVLLGMAHLVVGARVYDVAFRYEVLASGAQNPWALAHVHHHVGGC